MFLMLWRFGIYLIWYGEFFLSLYLKNRNQHRKKKNLSEEIMLPRQRETNSGTDKPFLDKGLLRVALQNNEQKGTIKKKKQLNRA